MDGLRSEADLAAGLVGKIDVCRAGVVIGGDAFHRNQNLERSLEYQVFEIQRFAVFLDGRGPYGFIEFDSAGFDVERRRLQEFIGGDVCVDVPALGNGNLDVYQRPFDGLFFRIGNFYPWRRHVVERHESEVVCADDAAKKQNEKNESILQPNGCQI